MNNQQILVIEDEPSVGEVVSIYLRRAGYTVTVLQDGKQALQNLEKQIPSLVILDLMLPGVDGFEITRWLRARGDTPIIMLSARRQETDRIAGLEMGADDYVIKPFSPQELVSRVRAVLRRTQSPQSEVSEETLSVGSIEINLKTRSVQVNGQDKILTVKEFDLLVLFVRHPRQVFSREHLLENVWGVSEFIDPGTVTVHVRRLREKIEVDPANPRYIQTIWGIGYKFEP